MLLSVQLRLTCVAEVGVAVRDDGAAGSGDAVVALALLLYPESPAALVAATRKE